VKLFGPQISQREQNVIVDVNPRHVWIFFGCSISLTDYRAGIVGLIFSTLLRSACRTNAPACGEVKQIELSDFAEGDLLPLSFPVDKIEFVFYSIKKICALNFLAIETF
jgi:hypothetical protein